MKITVIPEEKTDPKLSEAFRMVREKKPISQTLFNAIMQTTYNRMQEDWFPELELKRFHAE